MARAEAYITALQQELVAAHAAVRRAQERVSDIEAELRRAQGGAPETATVEAPEQAVPPKPRKG